MHLRNAMLAISVHGVERTRLGLRNLAEMNLRNGDVEMPIRVLYRSKRKRAVCEIEAGLPVVFLRGQIGKAQVRRRVRGVDSCGMRAGGLGIFKLLIRFEHLAEQGPGAGIIGIEIDRFADVRFGVGEVFGFQIDAGFFVLVMRGGRELSGSRRSRWRRRSFLQSKAGTNHRAEPEAASHPRRRLWRVGATSRA